MFLFHIIPKLCPNFGSSLPVKMNKNEKNNHIFSFIYFFFLNKEFNLWLLAFSYLMNLKTLIIHVSRNVLSFPKKTVLCMYLSVFIGNILLVTWSKIHVLVMLFRFHYKVYFACILVFWYIRSSKTLKGKFLVKIRFPPM